MNMLIDKISRCIGVQAMTAVTGVNVIQVYLKFFPEYDHWTNSHTHL